ncbi:hypothetical protein Psi01_15000 [Planobispora siamensis]|uniref:Uncharacterized protein n=1 Tax=Planobispora siamensis TaxID=936338 RepID=A0A8J3SCX5_9ACTN|nr:hypothetical protein Psi01_15000 [Planobispora siamensis]
MRGRVGHVELRSRRGGDAEKVVEQGGVFGDDQRAVQGCLPEAWEAHLRGEAASAEAPSVVLWTAVRREGRLWKPGVRPWK